jgi:Caudovirus prohead serine protease
MALCPLPLILETDMTFHIKSLAIKEMSDSGAGLALLANLKGVDNDGDTYAKGAFDWKSGGQWASMVPAHNWKEMPFGKAHVYEEGDTAFAELKLNLDTGAGRDWHSALKFDLATGNPVQEWSYGYDVLDHSFEMRSGQKIRVLKQLEVIEVSPVMRGAGKGTGTLEMKGVSLKDSDFAATLEQLQTWATALDSNPGLVSATGLKQLGEVHVAIGRALEARAKGAEIEPDLAAELAAGAYSFSLIRRHLPTS